MAAACLVLLMYSLHLEGRDISAAAAGIFFYLFIKLYLHLVI
jgi:hypothetical protein